MSSQLVGGDSAALCWLPSRRCALAAVTNAMRSSRSYDVGMRARVYWILQAVQSQRRRSSSRGKSKTHWLCEADRVAMDDVIHAPAHAHKPSAAVSSA